MCLSVSIVDILNWIYTTLTITFTGGMSHIGQHNSSLQVIACRHGVELGLGEVELVRLCYCPFTQVALLAGKNTSVIS